MRVIAGKAKGRRLATPAGQGTRPATDRVREAVFSIVGSWVEGARVLDLYAGSGSFGLEALSRGASSATFVENGRHALHALQGNIEKVGLGGTVVAASVPEFLDRSSGPYDLAFADPPWPLSSGELTGVLERLDASLGPSAEVVISRRHSDEEPVHPKNWRVATKKRYGDTKIIRYEKE